MAKFTPQTFNINDINNGEKFKPRDGVTPQAINAPIEAAAFVQALATNPPDTTDVDVVGTPSVTIGTDPTTGTPRFVFKNLKGATGEAGGGGSGDTTVTVGGVPQSIWNADTKIDMPSGADLDNSGNPLIPIIQTDGSTSYVGASSTGASNTVVVRNADGTIHLNTSENVNAPVINAQLNVVKQDVEKKLPLPEAINYAYDRVPTVIAGTSTVGYVNISKVYNVGDAIPVRAATGCLETPTAENSNECVPLGQLDPSNRGFEKSYVIASDGSSTIAYSYKQTLTAVGEDVVCSYIYGTAPNDSQTSITSDYHEIITTWIYPKYYIIHKYLEEGSWKYIVRSGISGGITIQNNGADDCIVIERRFTQFSGLMND